MTQGVVHEPEPGNLPRSHIRTAVRVDGGRAVEVNRIVIDRHVAGLVSDEQVGTRRLYRVERRYLTQVWNDVATRFKLFAENTATRTPRRR